MNIRDVLERHKRGDLSEAEAEKLLKLDFLESISSHTVFDHAREARRGIPEIVFGETKSPEVVADIVTRVMADREILLISRASKEQLRAIKKVAKGMRVVYVEEARMIVVDKSRSRRKQGKVGILAAGSSDIGVAEGHGEGRGGRPGGRGGNGRGASDRRIGTDGRSGDRGPNIGRLRLRRKGRGGVDEHAAILLAWSGSG
jgi:hypothetical protein